MKPHRHPRRTWWTALALAPTLFLISVVAVHAQGLPVEPVSAERRAELYKELAREVSALERQANLLKKVVQLAKPTVVHIEAKKAQRSSSRSRYQTVEEAGSGVVIERAQKFYVLTNRHVVNDAPLQSIKISSSDGRTMRPTRMWADAATDVAVMALGETDLVPAVIGDSDHVEIGDFVLAVGSPFGLSHSVTYGIVSAKGRRDLVLGTSGVRYQDFIQTDAAINPGNSGGPLLNLRGEVIGINTAIASASGGNEGIGFTIPINMFVTVAERLIDDGRVVRAYLGVLLDSSFTRAEALQFGMPRAVGAHVTGITPDSPAAGAKLQADDVILRFNGVAIRDDNDLINRVSLTLVGKEVEVVVLRAGKPLTVNVKVGDRAKYESKR